MGRYKNIFKSVGVIFQKYETTSDLKHTFI